MRASGRPEAGLERAVEKLGVGGNGGGGGGSDGGGGGGGGGLSVSVAGGKN